MKLNSFGFSVKKIICIVAILFFTAAIAFLFFPPTFLNEAAYEKIDSLHERYDDLIDLPDVFEVPAPSSDNVIDDITAEESAGKITGTVPDSANEEQIS